MIGIDPSMEGEHWRDILRHPMIGPRGEVILYNLQRRLGLGGQLEVKGGMEWRWIINKNRNGMTYNEDECSNGVVSKDGLILQDDLEGSVLLCPSFGPVLTTFDPCTLDQVCYHDDSGSTHLPHQTPKIHDCLIRWSCVCVCVCERWTRISHNSNA